MYTKQLRELYLEDLALEKTFEGKTFKRVKNINHWKAIKSYAYNGFVDPTGKRILVWSDTHFGHRNIIKYCNRPFKDQYQMNTDMLVNYRREVTDKDIVIFGGDVSFMGVEKTNDLLHRMPGYKILIVGNHDLTKDGKVIPYHFDEILLCHRHEQYLFTHYPLTNVPKGYINVHGHIHQKPNPSSKHINISVEWTNYKPIPLSSCGPSK